MSKTNKEYNKEYYRNNKEIIKEKIKDYREDNKDYTKEYNKEYRENNKEILREKRKQYYQINKDKLKEYKKKYLEFNKEFVKQQQNKRTKKRKEIDPLYKLTCNIRTRISQSIKSKGYQKESRTYEILGCPFEHFKEYIESFFIGEKSWMSWENYGNPKDGIYEPNKSWDIDHIKPISSFTTEQELLELNHYTNLQPLCSYFNRWIKRG